MGKDGTHCSHYANEEHKKTYNYNQDWDFGEPAGVVHNLHVVSAIDISPYANAHHNQT